MTSEQATALAILGGAAVLFVHGRLRVDFVALLVMLALAATGLCTPAEAVGGFGSTVVVLIGCLLVVGEGLSRTGTASLVGDAILRAAGGQEGRTRTMLVLAAAVLGSVMSSTAVVALFLPVALRIAAERQLAPARLLLPMAYGALVSGMLTLIGTAPNLVVHAELRGAGRSGFRLFDFTPVGGAVLAALLAAFAFGGRWLLPRRERAEAMPARPSVRELWRRFVPEGTLARFAVVPGSSLVGATARDTELGSRHGARVVAIQRQQPRSWRAAVLEPSPDHRFQAGDVVTVVGAADRLDALAPAFGLQRLPALPDASAALDAGFGVAVVMVPPESKLVGKSLAEVGFRTHHHLDVAGLRRDGEAVPDFVRTPLRAADMLLVLGPWARIRGLRDASHDLVVLTLPAESTAAAPARDRLPHALLILLAMVVVSALGAMPMVMAALAAAVAMVALRCVRLGDVYQAMSWSSLVLVAGMLPLATALDRTGVLALAVDGLQGLLAGAGPRVLLAVLFVVTAAIGSFLSNTATAVLMAPLALRLAESLQVAPEPLAMGVAIACSSAYLTPMGSPVVTLVYEAGGYRPGDLLRAGLPMFLATLLACVVLLPWLMPF
ncbi:MAG: SLC13 family permease [Planctomycetes bacterium]|nr:SLC13 family permease [Planctomycetota bacterium]